MVKMEPSHDGGRKQVYLAPYHDNYTHTNIQEFDALVVATGRYNAPKIPSIPGLGDVARNWPDHVHHSREYRKPHVYSNKASA